MLDTQPARLGKLKLSPNFYLSELVVSDTATRLGIDNQPDTLVLSNLFKLAELLEQVRTLLGNRAVLVSSGYRSPALNAAIRGAKGSEHMTGCAADFTCPSFGSPLEVCQAIKASDVQFGQLIQEGNRWVHISLPGVRQREVLTAHFDGGKTRYTRGL